MASSLSFRNARHLRTKNGQTKAGCAPKGTPCQFIYISQCALRPAQSTLRTRKRPGEGFLLLEGQNALAVGRITAVHEVEGCLCILEVPSVGDAAAQIHLALVDQIDDILELAVLQAAAANVQLLGSDDELVDPVGATEKPMVMTRPALPVACRAVSRLPLTQAASMVTVGP